MYGCPCGVRREPRAYVSSEPNGSLDGGRERRPRPLADLEGRCRGARGTAAGRRRPRRGSRTRRAEGAGQALESLSGTGIPTSGHIPATSRAPDAVSGPRRRGEEHARAAEAARIRARLLRGAWTVALDPDAPAPRGSEAFAVWLRRRIESGRPPVLLHYVEVGWGVVLLVWSVGLLGRVFRGSRVFRKSCGVVSGEIGERGRWGILGFSLLLLSFFFS